jgi:hypothetical protein
MRIWTAHAAPHSLPPRLTGPVLVPEGFAWGAFLLPPGLWFALRGMWVTAVLHLGAFILLAVLVPPGLDGWAALALQLLAGFEARDQQRRGLARAGRPALAVVAGPDEETALLRLLGARPDLVRAP